MSKLTQREVYIYLIFPWLPAKKIIEYDRANKRKSPHKESLSLHMFRQKHLHPTIPRYFKFNIDAPVLPTMHHAMMQNTLEDRPYSYIHTANYVNDSDIEKIYKVVISHQSDLVTSIVVRGANKVTIQFNHLELDIFTKRGSQFVLENIIPSRAIILGFTDIFLNIKIPPKSEVNLEQKKIFICSLFKPNDKGRVSDFIIQLGSKHFLIACGTIRSIS